MMHGNILQCRTLPAINETFPRQFNRPNSLLSPLDLSLRASNAIPITPPSTPSPPRKRRRLMSEENYLWRPHVMETAKTVAGLATARQIAATSSDTVSYFENLTYTNDEEVDGKNKDNYLLEVNNLEEIPQSHKASTREPATYGQQQQQNKFTTIYVDDDETILLTEDEDETLVSSHDYKADVDGDEDDDDDEEDNLDEDEGEHDEAEHEARSYDSNDDDHDKDRNAAVDEEEDEYVDILSNDDDQVEPLSAIALLRLRTQAETENTLESSGKVLTRNKLIYEDEELHNQAVDGLAKLFDREFYQKPNEDKAEKTYTDLTTMCSGRVERVTELSTSVHEQQELQQSVVLPITTRNNANHPKTYKTGERKRMKLRKHLSVLDEDTISPVSGTIIRKLRDDEELVVRKGDIDPAFNVVEITEEAKAILASIDNKIGDYLCQLCRTLYDDAFQLAQHRCPRIVHIEYKCSECEKIFNCPANLASHRRWHKPKSELLANGQKKPRQANESQTSTINSTSSPNVKSTNNESNGDNSDGIFPCTQCGKTFRRHAYLKKHLASHQMLDNLHSLDIFKNCSSMNNLRSIPTYQAYRASQVTASPTSHLPNNNVTLKSAAHHHTALYQPVPSQAAHANQHQHHHANKLYPQRFGAFPFPPPFDQRRFYNLEDLYFSQQLERNSAFQYVQATHLRNIAATNGSAAATGNNFLARPSVPTLMSMSVQ